MAFLDQIARAQGLPASDAGSSDPEPTPIPPPETATNGGVLNADSVAAIVDALKALHARQQPDRNGNGSSYEKNQQHFSELAAKLKEQAASVERRLGSMAQDQPALHALHQTLHLRCQPRGKAHGQFRCDNKTGRTAHVDLRARALHRGSGPCHDAAIAVTPNRMRLAAGEAALLAVEVDFGRCAEITNETLEANIDLHLNERMALRLFLHVEVADKASDKAEAEAETTPPNIELHDIDAATLRVLLSIQGALLNHPIAFQAAFSALIAEGKEFENTPEGTALKARLEGSDLLHQLRYVFDLSTFSLLEREVPAALPSTYFDTLFMLAANERSDEILDRLFQEMSPK